MGVPVTFMAPLTWHTSVDANGGGGAVVVVVCGELDRGNVPPLEQELDRLAARRPPALILDLHDVTFADLGAYRMLETLSRAMTAAGRGLLVRRTSLAVRRLLQLVGVPTGVIIDDPAWRVGVPR